MNQRIYDLAGQAKFMAEEELNRKISYNAELKAFAEKFAELIVKECMKLNHDHFSDEDPYSIDSLYRQHFGVEE